MPTYSANYNFNYTLQRSDMQAGDEYFLKIKKGSGNSFQVRLKNSQI
jgi:hypothetical protein